MDSTTYTPQRQGSRRPTRADRSYARARCGHRTTLSLLADGQYRVAHGRMVGIGPTVEAACDELVKLMIERDRDAEERFLRRWSRKGGAR